MFLLLQHVVPGSSYYSSQTTPLDREWAERAKKELKGKDVAETLTWKTAEVLVLCHYVTNVQKSYIFAVFCDHILTALW